MHIIRRIEQILSNLRPVFSRHDTYEWFVILIWGILLCNQHRAVTSYLNAVGLTQNYYTQALHWFHSQGISAQKLSTMWHKWLITHPKVHRLRGQPVYVGDGIKVGKEGKKMLGVKKLHNESENVTKPEWIRGHYFGAIALMLEAGYSLKAVPVILGLQDGIKTSEDDETTIVERMSSLCVELIDFDEKDCFMTETVLLYGKMVTLRYRCCDLYYRFSCSKSVLCTSCVARWQKNNPAFN